MDISSLKVVLLVEAQGSLAGAARVLGVDPSSISRIVSSVESELGVRLFQRTTRRLVATDEGRTYLQRLAPLLEEIDAAREEAIGKRSQPNGVLRLTASTAFSTEVIVPHLAEFRTRYPDIAIDLISHDANLDLVENQIDLAIRLAPVPKGDLISTRLMTTAYRVVASPAYLKRHPVGGAPSDVAGHDCLRFALPDFQDRWLYKKGSGEPKAVSVGGGLLFSNALSIRKAAVSGIGVALLADWMVREDLSTERLVDLFPDYQWAATEFDTAAWALYPSRAYLPQKVRVMIDYLRKVLS